MQQKLKNCLIVPRWILSTTTFESFLTIKGVLLPEDLAAGARRGAGDPVLRLAEVGGGGGGGGQLLLHRQHEVPRLRHSRLCLPSG
jgi:hypothetical protein